MQVELALEHDRDDVRYALRLGTGVEHFLQTLGMMRMLLAYTFVHSPQRAAVGRQYQSAFRQDIVGSQRVQIQRHGIGDGLEVDHPYVGGSARPSKEMGTAS